MLEFIGPFVKIQEFLIRRDRSIESLDIGTTLAAPEIRMAQCCVQPARASNTRTIGIGNGESFIRRSVKSRPTRSARVIASRNPALQVTAVDEEGKDAEDAQVDLPKLPVHHTPAVAATTCSGQWRRDARVLGSLPFAHWGPWAPSICALSPLGTLSLWVASPGVLGQLPFSLGRF